MKRIVLAGVVAFVVALVTAQTAFAQVQVGIRGGANWGFASKPDFLNSLNPVLQLSAGPTAAIFLDVPLSDRVSFRPEVAYVQKGFAVKQSMDLNLGGFTLPLGARIAYQSQNIELPLLFKVNLTDGPVQPYLIAGPSVGYALSGRVRTRATALITTRPIDVNVNYGDMLNRWDASAVGGLGLAMDAGAGKFFIEGRYTHGFTRQVQVPVVNINARNRGVAVSLGYSFPIGGY
ncbi:MULTISPECIES: porin family protein [Spirosoma]|uniref:PorT family protein n=1 Tax=Spirosoma liriopis TaxID=2937440 RepID=A0ABT0HIW8_9BACT|nr:MULTISPECIES: porin family protein [Spirosoma]MCK8491540.1 PorT family protein [Spirosoma liriopis]UHG90905.1 PorT family protein [Spirosoma oryzicola]